MFRDIAKALCFLLGPYPKTVLGEINTYLPNKYIHILADSIIKEVDNPVQYVEELDLESKYLQSYLLGLAVEAEDTDLQTIAQRQGLPYIKADNIEIEHTYGNPCVETYEGIVWDTGYAYRGMDLGLQDYKLLISTQPVTEIPCIQTPYLLILAPSIDEKVCLTKLYDNTPRNIVAVPYRAYWDEIHALALKTGAVIAEENTSYVLGDVKACVEESRTIFYLPGKSSAVIKHPEPNRVRDLYFKLDMTKNVVVNPWADLAKKADILKPALTRIQTSIHSNAGQTCSYLNLPTGTNLDLTDNKVKDFWDANIIDSAEFICYCIESAVRYASLVMLSEVSINKGMPCKIDKNILF